MTAGEAHLPPRLERFLAARGFLAAALILAAALRVAHVLSLRSLPLFDTLIVDSRVYDAWAQRIAAGDWLGGDRAFYMDPLYPYFLAVLYRLFGHDLLLVRLVQAALGVGTCALVAVIGRRVGGRAIGNLAALLLALYAPAIFQEAEVEKTALGMFLVTASLALVLRSGAGARAGAGACLALAALTRGNLLLLAPFGALFVLLSPAQGSEPRGWRGRLLGAPGRGAAAFALGFLAVLSVVAARNHHVSGEWILTTAGGGQNLYTGNNPANRTGAYEYVPFVRPEPSFEETDFRAEAESRTGRRMTAREVSDYWYRETFRHVAAAPGFAARVLARKLALFWSDFEMPDAWDLYFLARYSPVLRLPLLGMGLLLPLAALGAAVGLRARREVRLLVGYAAVYSASVIAFFVFSRYRLHVVPALVVLAASAAPWLAGVVRARDARRGAVAAIALVGVSAFSFLGARAAGIPPREDPQSFISLAWLHQERGDLGAAEALLLEALEGQRGAGRAGPLCALGDLHLVEGDVERAIAATQECARANPAYPNAWARLGTAFERAGRPADAATAYEVQLEVVPGHAEARAWLGRLRATGAAP